MADSAPAPPYSPPIASSMGGSVPATLLDRPDAQRFQEFKYRLGQSVVFGLPVLALEWFGRSLGGAEADRWVSILQALLVGWVVYVGAAGMLAEGILLFLARRPISWQIRASLCIASISILAYLAGLIRLAALVTGLNRLASACPHSFPWTVVLIAGWSAGQVWRMSRGPNGTQALPG